MPHPDGAAVQERTSPAVAPTTPCSSIRSPCTTELRGATIASMVGRPAAPVSPGASTCTVASSNAGEPRADETRKDAPPTRMPASFNASMATL